MAGSLKEAHTWRAFVTLVIITWLGGAFAESILWHAGAYAESINDPTRPPVAVIPPQSGERPAEGAKLQAVMITPTAQSAIINGERIQLGAAYGDAKVIKITEHEVVLRSAEGTQTLKMYPDILMQPSKEEAPQKAVQKNNKRRR